MPSNCIETHSVLCFSLLVVIRVFFCFSNFIIPRQFPQFSSNTFLSLFYKNHSVGLKFVQNTPMMVLKMEHDGIMFETLWFHLR